MIRNEAQRVREPAAMLLLAAMALSVIAGIWTLLSARSQLIDVLTAAAGGGLNFGDRGLEAFGYFGAVYVTALPVAAVVLATLTGEKVARARQLTQAAVVLQAVALVLGVICLLAAFSSHLSGTGKAQNFFASVASLAVAVAGLMFSLAVMRSAELRGPAPVPATPSATAATLQIKPLTYTQPGYAQQAARTPTQQPQTAQAQAAYDQQPYPQGYAQPDRSPAQQQYAQPGQQQAHAQPGQAQAHAQPGQQQAHAQPGYAQQSYPQQPYGQQPHAQQAQPSQQAHAQAQPSQQGYAQPGQQPYAQPGYGQHSYAQPGQQAQPQQSYTQSAQQAQQPQQPYTQSSYNQQGHPQHPYGQQPYTQSGYAQQQDGSYPPGTSAQHPGTSTPRADASDEERP